MIKNNSIITSAEFSLLILGIIIYVKINKNHNSTCSTYLYTSLSTSAMLISRHTRIHSAFDRRSQKNTHTHKTLTASLKSRFTSIFRPKRSITPGNFEFNGGECRFAGQSPVREDRRPEMAV